MNRNASPPTAPYTVLRLYFEHGNSVAGRTGWRKLLGQTLTHALLRAAQAQGIGQALAFTVTAGYLRGDALHHGHHEHMPIKHPQFVGLVDSPYQIARFLEQNELLLAQVRVLLQERGSVER